MRYQNKLKQILNEYYKNYSFINPDTINLTQKQTLYLCGKSLITVKNYTDGAFSVKPTGLGITYFDDRRDQLIRFWIPTSISLLALIKSFLPDIILLAQLIAQSMQLR